MDGGSWGYITRMWGWTGGKGKGDAREEILWGRAKLEGHLRGHIEAYYYRNFWKNMYICGDNVNEITK